MIAAQDRWKKLPAEERAAIAVLALHATPMARSRWVELLAPFEIRRPAAAPGRHARSGPQGGKGRKLSTGDLRSLIAAPQAQGLLSEPPHAPGYYFVPPSALPLVLGDPDSAPLLRAVLQQEGPLEQTPPRSIYGWELDQHIDRGLRVARAALYLGEPALCQRAFDYAAAAEARGYRDPARPGADLSLRLLPAQAPAQLVRQLPPGLWRRFLTHAVDDALRRPRMLDADVLRLATTDAAAQLVALRPAIVCLMALGAGDPDAGRSLGEDESPPALQARAMLALRRGDVGASRELTLRALQSSRGPKGKRKPWIEGPLAPLLTLVLATGGAAERSAATEQTQRAQRKREHREAYAPVACLLEGRHPATEAREPSDHWLTAVMALLVGCYLGDPVGEDADRSAWLNLEGVHRVAAAYDDAGFGWLARQVRGVAAAMHDSRGGEEDRLLIDLATPIPAWKRGLQRLQELAEHSPPPSDTPDENTTARERLVYVLTPHDVDSPHGAGPTLDVDAPDFVEFATAFYELGQRPPPQAIEDLRWDLRGVPLDQVELTPDDLAVAERLGLIRADPAGPSDNLLPLQITAYRQKRGTRGYSQGKLVSLRRLAEGIDDLSCATDQDRRIAASLGTRRDWYGKREYFCGPRALAALVGHPYLFLSDGSDQVLPKDTPTRELVRGDFTLRVVEGAGGLRLQLWPPPDGDGMALHQDPQGRLALCELSARQREVQAALDLLPAVPEAGRAELDRALGGLATLFPIHAQTSVAAASAQKVPADPIPTILLERADPGIALQVVSMPLGPAGPSVAVGEGLPAVTCSIDGEAMHCMRDLQAERTALQALVVAVPQLTSATSGQKLRVDALRPCLELLRALTHLGDRAHLLWTAGEPITVLDEAGSELLSLRLHERQQWLEVDGTLDVSEALVLSLGELLSERASSGFVEVGKDRYLPLSDALTSQLSSLRAVAAPPSKRAKDDTAAALRLPPAALGFVSTWLRTLRSDALSMNPRARQRLQAIQHAMDSTPALPKTLQAELRAYQREGFEFLSRLSQVGAGAVLADDMGLGKTLMTLALLLQRATSGPALVVAPVSVKGNWCDEALRFAPTLNLRRMDRGDDDTLTTLGPFDVLVCSYAVMTLEAEALATVQWSTLVLDEAQAIKNPGTQRAKAARTLAADARVALTGTPVENNLGDLYSLMSFLNPGLLGSAKQFETRFGKPIQHQGDIEAGRTLRALIAPFTLRRRKADVLQELPPKTEITITVQPDEAELAFTEALRRDALARLARRGPTDGAVTILAEITRLRRAACHPTLVDAKAGSRVGAAKLDRALELLLQLKAEGHRALVFSQFVGFLKLVGAALTDSGLTYQYLDGSSSERNRAAAVRAFQAGEGDAFLISLKAGGFGLNLTAADYVIHLDPWWNPAVEAQASDRAHRIGQRRPVTVYRLVNADSVEERVLALHARKRELADELLQDAGEATRLDTASLMALLE